MRMVVPLLALLAGGCTSPAEPEVPAPAPAPAAAPAGGEEPRDMLVVARMTDYDTLFGVVNANSDDAEVAQHLTYDAVIPTFEKCRLTAKPGMSSEWSFADDGRTLRMTFPPGQRWEDGQPLTLQDLAKTWELVGDPAVGSPRLGLLDDVEPGSRPKIVDESHVEWRFTRALEQSNALFSVNSIPWVPAHALGPGPYSNLRAHPLSKQPLSYGPFRLQGHVPGQNFELAPNPNFSGPPAMHARLKSVLFRVIPDYQTRLSELQAGRVDHMRNVAVADADVLEAQYPQIALYRRGWRTEDYVTWNLEDPMFKDVRVRRALAMAVDVDAMIARLLTSKKGVAYGRRATGNITPELCDVLPEDLQPLAFQLDEAKRLLAEAGWTDTDGDGLVDHDGKPLQFTLLTNSGNQRRADASVLLQDAWKRVGVRADLASSTGTTVAAKLRGHDYQAVLFGFSASLFVDPGSVWKCSTPEHPVELNYGGYCNPDVDALIDVGAAKTSYDEAVPVWKEVQRKVYADQPMLFLYWIDEIVAVDRRFQNVKVDVMSSIDHLEEWYVPADQVKYP